MRPKLPDESRRRRRHRPIDPEAEGESGGRTTAETKQLGLTAPSTLYVDG